MTWLYYLQLVFLFMLVAAAGWLAFLAVVNDRD
jgi:hypothetical protein